MAEEKDRKTGLAGTRAFFQRLPAAQPEAEPEPEPEPEQTEPAAKPQRQKKDYHQSKMLGVRVPYDLADKVKEAAQGQGISINAWLLELIEREIKKGG